MANTESKVIIGLDLQIQNALKSIREVQGAIAKIDIEPSKKINLTNSFAQLEKEIQKASTTAAQGFKDSKEMERYAYQVSKLKNEFESLIREYNAATPDANKIVPSSKEFEKATKEIDKTSKAIGDLQEKTKKLGGRTGKGTTADIVASANEGMSGAALKKDKEGIESYSINAIDTLNEKRQESEDILSNIEILEEKYNATTESGYNAAIGKLSQLIELRREYWQLTKGSESKFEALPLEKQTELSPITKITEGSLTDQQKTITSSWKEYKDILTNIDTITKNTDSFTKFTEEIEKQNIVLQKNLELRNKLYLQAQTITAEGQASVSSGISGIAGSFSNVEDNLASNITSQKQVEATAKSYDKLKNSIQRLTGTTAVFSLMRRAIQDIWQDVKLLDAQFNQIAIVTDYTTSEMWQSFSKVNKIAQEYGVSASNVVSVQKLYYQQGKSTAEVTQLTAETLTLAKISGLEYADATDKMTAALNAYNIKASEASIITDTLSALAAQSAADTQEIADALTRTASIAANAGMDIQQTSVWLTKMIEVTREAPENLGTALKTIIARFSEIKDLSEDEQSLLGGNFDFNRVEKALRFVNIAAKDISGQMRDVNDIFMDLSKIWDTLDRNTQRYIATMAAGSRQQSRFIAMIDNYQETMRLVSITEESAGTGALQLATSMESIETSLNNLKSAWQELYTKFVENDLFKLIIDNLTNIVLGASNVSSALKVIIASFLIFKGVMLAVSGARALATATEKLHAISIWKTARAKVADTAASEANTVSETKNTVATGAQTFAKQLEGKSIWGVITAKMTEQALTTLGISLAVAAITVTLAIATAKQAEAKATTEAEEAATEYNTSLTEQNNVLGDLITLQEKLYRYKVLNLKIDHLTNDEQTEYNELIEYLAENLDNAIESYDAEGNAILKNNEALNEAIKIKAEAMKQQEAYNLILEKQLALQHNIYTINSKAGETMSNYSATASTYANAEEGTIAYQTLQNYADALDITVEDLQTFFTNISNQVFGAEQLGLLIGKEDLTNEEFDTFIQQYNEALNNNLKSQYAFYYGLQGILDDFSKTTSLENFNSFFGEIVSSLSQEIPSALEDLTINTLSSQFAYLNEVKDTGLSEETQDIIGSSLITASQTVVENTSLTKYELANQAIGESENQLFLEDLFNKIDAKDGNGDGEISAKKVLEALGYENTPEDFEKFMTKLGVTKGEDWWSEYYNFNNKEISTYTPFVTFSSDDMDFIKKKMTENVDQFKGLSDLYWEYIKNYSRAENNNIDQLQEDFTTYISETLTDDQKEEINNLNSQLQEGLEENNPEIIKKLNEYYQGFYDSIIDPTLQAAVKNAIQATMDNYTKEAIKNRDSIIEKLNDWGIAPNFIQGLSAETLQGLLSVLDVLTQDLNSEVANTLVSSIYSMLEGYTGDTEAIKTIISLLGTYGPEATDLSGIVKMNTAISAAGLDTKNFTEVIKQMTKAFITSTPNIEDVTETLTAQNKEMSEFSSILGSLMEGGSIENLSDLLNANFMTDELRQAISEGITITDSGKIKVDSEILQSVANELNETYKESIESFIETLEQGLANLLAEAGVAEISQLTDSEDITSAQSYQTTLNLLKQFASMIDTSLQESFIEAQKEAIEAEIEAWEKYISMLKELDTFSNFDSVLEAYNNRIEDIQTEMGLNLNVSRGTSLLNEEINSITQAMALEQARYNQAIEESAVYAKELTDNGYAYVDTLGNLVVDYDKLNELALSIKNASEDEAESLEVQYDMIQDYIDSYNELDSTAKEAYSNTLDYFNQLKEIYADELEYIITVQDKLLQLLQDRDDKELESLQKKYEALKAADEDYLSILKESIQKERDLRNQSNNEKELIKKEKKLNTLLTASGGKRTSEIIDLEEEIADARQSLADQAVNDLITQLEEETTAKTTAYDDELSYQEELLNNKKENMVAYNAEIKEIMSQNKEDIISYMQSLDDEYITGTTEAQAKWILEWEASVTNAKIAMDALSNSESPLVQTYNVLMALSEANDDLTTSITGYVEEIVGSIDQIGSAYESAYNKAQLLVNAYAAMIDEYERLQGLAPSSCTSCDSGEGDLSEQYANEGNTDAYNALEQYNNKLGELERAVQEAYAQVEFYSNAVKETQETLTQAKARYNAAMDNWKGAIRSNASPEVLASLRNEIDNAETAVQNSENVLANVIRKNEGAHAKYVSAQEALAAFKASSSNYLNGGLVSYTGPAWVDGTKKDPEAFLNSADTRNIANLVDILKYTTPKINNPTSPIVEKLGDTYYQIYIDVDELGEDYTIEDLKADIEEKILEASSKGKVTQL